MFKKWVEIENHYNKKFLEKFLLNYSDLKYESFQITEKIDGANFSFWFSKDGTWKVFSRKREVTNEDFYNWKTILTYPEINHFINIISTYCENNNRDIQFIGELFGKNIQNRINYGDSIYWRWFAIYETTYLQDAMSEPSLLSISEHEELIHSIDDELFLLYVPIIKTVQFFNSLNFNNIFESIDIENLKSKLSPTEDNVEGVVIRPYEDYYYQHDVFIIKYKSSKFNDKKSTKKKKQEIKLSEQFNNLYYIISEYINRNRTFDLFSKYGQLEDMKDLGKYIKWYAEDIFNDMNKNGVFKHVYNSLEKKEQKFFNKQINKKIAEELKDYLLNS